MAQHTVKLDQEKFSCSICLDLLKDPVTIHCGHTYCMNCIKHQDSCPQCRQPHYESPAFEKHKLVNLSKMPQVNICSHHNEVMNLFCRTDQKCICYLCSMDEHKGHDTVSVEAERNEKQREVKASQQKVQQRIQDREKDVKMLQQEMETINNFADEAVRESEKIFNELIHLNEKRSSDVKQQIRSRQETEVSQVKELQEKLQQEITYLKRKDTELKELSDTKDHIQFLQNYPSLSHLSEYTDSPSINLRLLQYFDSVTVVVSELRDKIQDVFREEPKTRDEFLKYSVHVTLDPNTAHIRLLLSEENKKATVMREEQTYTHHSDRFTEQRQVLSRESLTGCCYWEIKKEKHGAMVAVTYKDISRTGNESTLGSNDRSWALECDGDEYKLIHNKVSTSISGSESSIVGVYLDHSAGILSFYNVSDTMTLLHRVQTTFTQPLYAGLSVYGNDYSVELCELK
ncbi:tripartite motif-containing protein 16-like [Scomber scombrus]|uniref:tripartite motif-containing protein 16-like n=1 Tax=Scomber scombrus TaxID=13677 RepID=UPI002DD9DCE1|nr:tripartite motif-containing protein 16-like [Scomber scombrus]